MDKSHLLSAGEAARAVGVSTAAISKAIKAGRLPYVEKTKQGYRIDPAALFHVFRSRRIARLNGEAGGVEESGDLMPEVIALRIANARLEGELEKVKALLDAEWKRAERAEGERDGWRAMCELLLKKKAAST